MANYKQEYNRGGTLPVVVQPAATPVWLPTPAQDQPKKSVRIAMPEVQKSLRVLVIDPDEDYRTALVGYLRGHGYAIAGTFYNAEAIKYLLAVPEILIITFADTAPVYYQVVASVRRKYPDIKVIGIMEKSDRIVINTLKTKGVDGYLFKSVIDDFNLLKVIKAVMANEFTYPVK